MQIIDNVLDKEQLELIQKATNLNSNLAWFYADHVSVENANDGFYFVHNVYANDQPLSEYYHLIKELFQPHLNWITLLKCKVNLFPKSECLIQYGFHIDQPFKHKDAVFYLNTNNGYTEFKDGTKVESKANRLLLFENNEEHASTNCTDEYARFNINFNYF